jgi:hypothetical protein
VRDFVLQFVPGNTSESATLTCGGYSVAWGPTTAWTSTFAVTHGGLLETSTPATAAADLVASLSDVPIEGTGFVFTDWEIFGDEYFAKLEWIEEVGEVVEAGTFKLYHRPGQ